MAVRPVKMFLVGDELGIEWSDGHNSGIYSWEHFRRICQCPECNVVV